MGPYCQFCDRRCFVHNPRSDRRATILATCAAGRSYDREQLGYNIDDARTNASWPPPRETK